jgi:hypothetical protein
MREELEKQLVEKYPKIFVNVGSTPQQSPMAFGIETGDGWYNIIDKLCGNIQNYIDYTKSHREALLKKNPYNFPIPDEVAQVTADQVKEKFGTLRFYYTGGDAKIDGMARMAESMSAATCEKCGNVGKVRGKSWIYVSCDEHAREGD